MERAEGVLTEAVERGRAAGLRLVAADAAVSLTDLRFHRPAHTGVGRKDVLRELAAAVQVFEELGNVGPGAGKEIQLVDAIKRTIGRHPVVALEFEGDYYDTGTVAGYLRANVTMAMKREELRDELEPLLRELLQG